MEVIVGTYGQHLLMLELGTAWFGVLRMYAYDAENTSCLAMSPDKRFLFAVSESSADSAVFSFEVFPYDRLKPLPEGRIARRSEVRGISPDPCHLLYLPGYYNYCGDPDNGVLLTADYSGASVSLYPVEGGRIQPPVQVVRFEGSGPVPRRQETSHIHHLLPCGDFLLAADLGADCIHVLRLFDSVVRPLCDTRLRREPRLERVGAIPAPAGSGPRHLVCSADGRFLYVITELSNEILVYSLQGFTADGANRTDNVSVRMEETNEMAELRQRLPIGDPTFPTQAGGDIQLSPDGRHLYTSLRNGGDGLVICEIQPDGTLLRCGFQPTGAHVRDFSFLPAGLPPGDHLLACCKNDRCIQIFRRNAADGSLTEVQKISFDSDYYGEPVFGLPYS